MSLPGHKLVPATVLLFPEITGGPSASWKATIRRHLTSRQVLHDATSTYRFQRTAAALRAIWARLAELRALALALPPLRPPVRPKATAAGFLRSLPAPLSVANLSMSAASGFMSTLLERFGIAPKPISQHLVSRH